MGKKIGKENSQLSPTIFLLVVGVEMFLAKAIWRSLKNLSFCMGSSSKEDLNHRYPREKRVDNGK